MKRRPRGRAPADLRRCFPAWTETLTSQELVELTTYFLREMPYEICWLERTDGLKMGGGYPGQQLVSEPAIDPHSSP